MRRSRLSKLQAAEAALAQQRASLAENAAAFAAMPLTFGGFSPYHAAQSTRFRHFTGETLFGARPQHEDKLLTPYDRNLVISRVRIMIRNNPWLSAILLAYVQEIGTPTYKSTAQLATPQESAAYNDRRERLFERWARDCEADADLSLDEVLEIWAYESVIAGEMFIVRVRTGEIQLIASELCGSEKTGSDHLAGATFEDGVAIPAGATEEAGRIRLGRRVIGYRFAQRDADGTVSFAAEKTTLVRREWVTHLHDRDRIEQSTGVPRLCSALNKFQDLFETTDARAQQVKNAACLSMWITKNMDPYGFAEAMRGAMRTGSVADAAALKTLAEQRSDYKELRAGAIYVGAVNEDVKLIEPKLNAADWIEYYIGVLQVCCACLDGMPVEIGIEGFRRSNYSSSRATMNKWGRNVRRRRGRLQLKLLDPLQLWQTRRREAFGDLPAIPEAQREECAWGWPAIPDIDGAKTAAMNAVELANGSTTLQLICAEKGLHEDQVTKQRAAERIRYIRELAAQAEQEFKLPADKALAWAMSVASETANPALTALLTSALAPESSPGNASASGAVA